MALTRRPFSRAIRVSVYSSIISIQLALSQAYAQDGGRRVEILVPRLPTIESVVTNPYLKLLETAPPLPGEDIPSNSFNIYAGTAINSFEQSLEAPPTSNCSIADPNCVNVKLGSPGPGFLPGVVNGLAEKHSPVPETADETGTAGGCKNWGALPASGCVFIGMKGAGDGCTCIPK
jgi:hypothetical protein